MHLQGVKCWLIKNELFKFDVSSKYMNLIASSSLAEIAQLGERQTEDLKVPGSMPESLIELWIIPGLGISFFKMISSVFLLKYNLARKLSTWRLLRNLVNRTTNCINPAKIRIRNFWFILPPFFF